MDRVPYVKICGITRPGDAALAVAAGADAIGLNFVPTSKRRIDVPTALAIIKEAKAAQEAKEAGSAAVVKDIDVVAVVADLTAPQIEELRDATGISWVQLHGDEPPETVRQLMPEAFKAVRIADADDVRRARLYPGSAILVDAKVEGSPGGAGIAFDWRLVKHLASERRLILAGGLTPENVESAILAVGPWGVDVASGVESAPGIKDPDKVRAFVVAARAATEKRLAMQEADGVIA
jgi:phosphoribosylanthranilate isomerase